MQDYYDDKWSVKFKEVIENDFNVIKNMIPRKCNK